MSNSFKNNWVPNILNKLITEQHSITIKTNVKPEGVDKQMIRIKGILRNKVGSIQSVTNDAIVTALIDALEQAYKGNRDNEALKQAARNYLKLLMPITFDPSDVQLVAAATSWETKRKITSAMLKSQLAQTDYFDRDSALENGWSNTVKQEIKAVDIKSAAAQPVFQNITYTENSVTFIFKTKLAINLQVAQEIQDLIVWNNAYNTYVFHKVHPALNSNKRKEKGKKGPQNVNQPQTFNQYPLQAQNQSLYWNNQPFHYLPNLNLSGQGTARSNYSNDSTYQKGNKKGGTFRSRNTSLKGNYKKNYSRR